MDDKAEEDEFAEKADEGKDDDDGKGEVGSIDLRLEGSKGRVGAGPDGEVVDASHSCVVGRSNSKTNDDGGREAD